MSDEVKLHKNESIKEQSRQLRGTLAEELRSGAEGFSADMEQLIKFHGFYQQEDRDARALAEQRVEADHLVQSIRAALAADGDLLSTPERQSLEAAIASVGRVRAGTDHRAVKPAVAALNSASESFAARRMDRAVSRALTGKRLDEVRVK